MSFSETRMGHEKQDLLVTRVLEYHNQMKLRPDNYDSGTHDWTIKPNPFRRYLPASLLPLPLPHNPNASPSYTSVFNSLPSPKPLSRTTISQFLYNSLALSAWKSNGVSSWSLRVNPSSGNFHPTESYIISPPLDSLSDESFIAHYAPKEHGLEIRAQIPSCFLAENFPQDSFLIGFSTIFWREAWKYKERAFRYCHHDIGHAIAAVSMAAAGLGWDVRVLDGMGHEELKKLMGLEIFSPDFSSSSRRVDERMLEIESEHPSCILLVFPGSGREFEVDYEKLGVALSEFSNLGWKGRPNVLSEEHVCWDVVYETAEVVRKPLTITREVVSEAFVSSGMISESSYKGFSLSELVRKRRTAHEMDGVTTVARETFYQILFHCLPSGRVESGKKQGKQLALPFRALPWDCEVDAALFVHRVVGLPRGLYFLVRNEAHLDELRTSTRSDFRWVKPDGCPNNLPLYELAQGDYLEFSGRVSCHQYRENNGCFGLGIIAHLEPTLRRYGAWMYPRLFWETGVLGQVLYLEAHAVGVSATGIGCFFDDPVTARDSWIEWIEVSEPLSFCSWRAESR